MKVLIDIWTGRFIDLQTFDRERYCYTSDPVQCTDETELEHVINGATVKEYGWDNIPQAIENLKKCRWIDLNDVDKSKKLMTIADGCLKNVHIESLTSDLITCDDELAVIFPKMSGFNDILRLLDQQLLPFDQEAVFERLEKCLFLSMDHSIDKYKYLSYNGHPIDIEFINKGLHVVKTPEKFNMETPKSGIFNRIASGKWLTNDFIEAMGNLEKCDWTVVEKKEEKEPVKKIEPSRILQYRSKQFFPGEKYVFSCRANPNVIDVFINENHSVPVIVFVTEEDDEGLYNDGIELEVLTDPPSEGTYWKVYCKGVSYKIKVKIL